MRILRSLLALSAMAMLPNLAPAARAAVVSPELALTQPTADDQDDLCIWIHPTDSSLSTMIVSDKDAELLVVYDLQGNVVQGVATSGRPGNVDLRYGFPFAGAILDIVVVNNRTNNRIHVYEVDAVSRTLTRIDSDNLNSPSNYGLCLYRSPTVGAFHVFTTTKTGFIRQFELFDSGGQVAMTEVRTWSIGSITEGCVADDETGHVYLADEHHGIWKVGAEPGVAPPGTLIAEVGDGSGLAADIEGLAIYYAAAGGGYLIASSQSNSCFKVFDRAVPHAFASEFSVSGSGATDGIDVTNVDLGPAFPFGLFASHNGPAIPRRVDVCAFEDLGLAIDTGYWNPRAASPTSAGVRLPSPAHRVSGRPNPFRESTSIRFELQQPGSVSLRVVDAAGRRVIGLLGHRWLESGPHTLAWDGRDAAGRPVAGGVYFYELETASGATTGKTTVIR